MHNKTVKFTDPLNGQKVMSLDRFLSDVAKNGLKGILGTYTGDGTTGKAISIGFCPYVLLISKEVDLGKSSFPVAGNMVFSLSNNEGVSYVPGTGFVKDAVLSFDNAGAVLGSNANVNASNTPFVYFAIG